MYKKRAGTSGIQGQLYETKLTGLFYFRLIHDSTVEQFSLATNRGDTGAFDDICFKAKITGHKKPVAVFIQAKHRENDKLLTLTSNNDLAKYFRSYLEIRRAFEPKSKDLIFGGNFDETECFFVMYTTAKDDPNNKIYEGALADFLNELIGTGGCSTQPMYRDEDLDFLCKIIMKEELKILADQLAKYIRDEFNSEVLMNNDIMLRYHVILAQNVLNVSEIQPEGHRLASFRQEFFTSEDEFLTLFKNTLCLEVLKKRKSDDTNMQTLLLNFLNEPSDITSLSKLIGSVLTYKNDKLEFISKSVSDDLKCQLDKTNVSQSDVFAAAELATKQYLLTLKLKVLALFGNKDLYIRGNHEKIQKRLNYLASKIVELLEQSKPNNIIAIEESLEDGFLKLNGGLASAIGNLLVYDETSKLFKFTDDSESLGNVAKTLYEALVNKIGNLHEYKLDVKVKKFPKLSFERGEYDVSLMRDFYKKLLFYTEQADQSGIEEILREEIEDHPCNDVNNFRARSDVIFLKYHDEIQKLWMTPKMGSYITKKSKIYENVIANAMSESLMGNLNIWYKITNKDFTFNENATKPFEKYGELVNTVIATGNYVLAVAKVEQYLGNKDHVVLDLEYIFKLRMQNHNALCKELSKSTKKIFIIVCNKFEESRNSRKRLNDIAKAVDGKRTIIIANKNTLEVIVEYFSKASSVLNDKRTIFTDMSDESQKKLLANSKMKFQDDNLNFDLIVDEESAKLIDEQVLNQMINSETIAIGKTVLNYNYEKARPFYIDRRISRIKKQEHDTFDDVKEKVLESLYDLEDDVVLITALPGMGKSTLLTHLSLKTKKLNPKVWVVRINLLEYARVFSKWQDDKTLINTVESLKFICQAAAGEVSDEQYKEDGVLIKLDESEEGTVLLNKRSSGSPTEFQLKMFLHFYNTGKLIFLFDGFDEIIPHYEREALSLLKAVRSYPRKHKIWITSRSFNYVKSILEQEFGTSYEIDPLTCLEQDIYFNTFWKSKIQFRNLNNEQIRNVHDFVHFMQSLLPAESFRVPSLLILNPYFKVYLNFLEFLKLESLAAGIEFAGDAHSFLTSLDIREFVTVNRVANNLTAPPLHLYILAECFHNKIKDIESEEKNWDIDVTGYMFYEYYFETKIKKIRFEEKNKIDLFNPDNKMTYDKIRADSLAMHKKLGAYAIFYPNLDIFEEDVLEEIKDMIRMLNNGRDKTGLIRTVANNIPLFVHMSFAEYFAVEYISDLLQNESKPIQEKLWTFIVNVMFRNCSMNVFDIFNTKIKMDETLRGVVERNKGIINRLISDRRTFGSSSNRMELDRIDRIAISNFPGLYDSFHENRSNTVYLYPDLYSNMFCHVANHDGTSFSVIELSNRYLTKGEINNSKWIYLFLRIRDSILFYQGILVPQTFSRSEKQDHLNKISSEVTNELREDENFKDLLQLQDEREEELRT